MNDDRIARFARQLLVPGLRRGGAGAARRGARARGGRGRASPPPALVFLVQAGRRPALDRGRRGRRAGRRERAGSSRRPRSVRRASTAARAVLAPALALRLRGAVPDGRRPDRDARRSRRPSPQALASAEAARRAGIPHVVARAGRRRRRVVVVPPGAPCYACARSTTGVGPPRSARRSRRSPRSRREELSLMIAIPGTVPGARSTSSRGVRPRCRATGRPRRACACAGGRCRATA